MIKCMELVEIIYTFLIEKYPSIENTPTLMWLSINLITLPRLMHLLRIYGAISASWIFMSFLDYRWKSTASIWRP